MKRKYVILRRMDGPSPAMMGRSASSPADAPVSVPLAVETDYLPAARVPAIASKTDVEYVSLVVPMKLIAPIAAVTAADPMTGGCTWGLKAVGADTSPFNGDGVVVAVLDTGIDPTHPAFADLKLIRKNFTQEHDDDLHGHGTHCAGTILGRAAGGTRIGVAPGVKTAVIGKVLGKGGGGSDSVLAAIQWALQSGANIISMSLGIDFPGLVADLEHQGVPTELATSMALEGYRANVIMFERVASLIRAQSAFSQPCLLVAAAGNESRRDENPDFRIAVSPPAAAEGIVSVAALGNDPQGLVIAGFSNVGARLGGPGVGVMSAKLGGGMVSMNGTSMATPHVAGVAALWAQKLRAARQLTIRLFADRLVGSATVTGFKPGFEPADIGAGIVRAPQD